MSEEKIRNFCIIAHIDHGKSTLADRFLELTGTIEKRKMQEQILDMMELERERGITIKLQPVRMEYRIPNSIRDKEIDEQASLGFRSDCLILNLIDTPGHVDFNYEVSRSLAAVEGAVLLIDATQGVQAQTLGNLYLALEQNLVIIPVINKIDLPNAQIERTREEILHLLGCQEDDILLVSAKTGQGVSELLQTIIRKVPPPSHSKLFIPNFSFLRALIFDSKYDEYRGVVIYLRVFNGEVRAGDKIRFLASNVETEVLEVGYFKPELTRTDKLTAGEIGYLVTGLKNVSSCRVGETITNARVSSLLIKPLPGYKEVKPMVFAGIFPKEGSDFQKLREAVEKLKLNDASLVFEPERLSVLGAGLRCGFLGLLHLEIFQERLKREYGLEVIVTIPSVAYKVKEKNGEEKIVRSALEMPEPVKIEKIEEPWMKVDILVPFSYVGAIMQLAQERYGIYKNMEYLVVNPQNEGRNLETSVLPNGEEKNEPKQTLPIVDKNYQRVILHYELPLASILTDFYDKLKSLSSGYASVSYEFLDYRPVEIVRLDILVAENRVEALSLLVRKEEVEKVGRRIVETLKTTIPRQMFEVKIQAAVGGKIIASERLPALRKDVLAKLYGGDVTRKMKLLEKQKKGKKTLQAKGHVELPSEAYLAILKR
jgi:GTP-binding protein LepA